MTTATKNRTAAEVVTDHMASCLPPGTPPCYRSILKARFHGGGRKRVALADLMMFDGQLATIEVFQWGGEFGHRWISMPGGDAFFEDGRWRRAKEAGL